MTLDAVYDSYLHQYRCDVTPEQDGCAMNNRSDPIADASRTISTDVSALRDIIARIIDGRSPIDVTAQSTLAQRRAKRVAWQAPLDLGDAKGVMRDISESGVYFETVDTYSFSSLTNFEVDFDLANSNMRLKCCGEIVRIEPCRKKVGVAVRLIEASIATG